MNIIYVDEYVRLDRVALARAQLLGAGAVHDLVLFSGRSTGKTFAMQCEREILEQKISVLPEPEKILLEKPSEPWRRGRPLR